MQARTYAKDGSTVTVEIVPGGVRVTYRTRSRPEPHVSHQYGNPRKLARSIGADLRADGYTAAA